MNRVVTAAATRARRVKRMQRIALDLVIGIPLLPDEWLCALARAVMAEVSIREAGAR